MATNARTASLSQVTAGNRVSVREVFLSDGSPVYDVLIDGAEFYNAYNEEDAHNFVRAIRALIREYEGSHAKIKIEETDTMFHRLNALSYRFAFDSYEARLCGEAATLLQSTEKAPA